MKVFVYGTLLKGENLNSFLNDSPFIGYGFTQGVLFDLGYYPGIKEGHDHFYGELYEVNDQTLHQLDQLEGYYEKNPDQSLYIRTEVAIIMLHDGSLEQAYVYFYNRECADENKIICGDYRRYKMEKSTKDAQWYIAYGSNMSRERLVERIGPIAEERKAHIKGYRLVFNKIPGYGKGAYANISYAPECRCPCVAYKVSLEQLKDLDGWEGEPYHYVRLGVPGGHIYVAHPSKLVWDHTPSRNYLRHIYQGYEKHGFETTDLPPL